MLVVADDNSISTTRFSGIIYEACMALVDHYSVDVGRPHWR